MQKYYEYEQGDTFDSDSLIPQTEFLQDLEIKIYQIDNICFGTNRYLWAADSEALV